MSTVLLLILACVEPGQPTSAAGDGCATWNGYAYTADPDCPCTDKIIPAGYRHPVVCRVDQRAEAGGGGVICRCVKP